MYFSIKNSQKKIFKQIDDDQHVIIENLICSSSD